MTGLAIDVRSNIRQVSRWLDKTQKRNIPFAVSQALNDTAFQLTKGGGRRGVNSVLGKATNETFTDKAGGKGASNYTRTGFKYDKSRKTDLTAWVYFDPTRGDYMEYQVYGGFEAPKRKYIVVPTQARKSLTDKYGNIRNKVLDSVLKDKSKFFEGVPKGHPSAGRGIWERYGRKKENYFNGFKIRMVAAYEPGGDYKPLFKFAETVDGYVFGRQGFDRNFVKRLEKALRTDRARR